jgi:hypothetical protein
MFNISKRIRKILRKHQKLQSETKRIWEANKSIRKRINKLLKINRKLKNSTRIRTKAYILITELK